MEKDAAAARQQRLRRSCAQKCVTSRRLRATRVHAGSRKAHSAGGLALGSAPLGTCAASHAPGFALAPRDAPRLRPLACRDARRRDPPRTRAGMRPPGFRAFGGGVGGSARPRPPPVATPRSLPRPLRLIARAPRARRLARRRPRASRRASRAATAAAEAETMTTMTTRVTSRFPPKPKHVRVVDGRRRGSPRPGPRRVRARVRRASRRPAPDARVPLRVATTGTSRTSTRCPQRAAAASPSAPLRQLERRLALSRATSSGRGRDPPGVALATGGHAPGAPRGRAARPPPRSCFR